MHNQIMNGTVDEAMLAPEDQTASTPPESEERKHFLRIVNAFKQYRVCSLIKIAKTEKYLTELPTHHQQLLEGYREHLKKLSDCVNHNDSVIQQITKHVGSIFETDHPAPDIEDFDVGPPTISEYDKVLATLKQLVRDWSSDGLQERIACYDPIVNAIHAEFSSSKNSCNVQVLVPGAGLGRLVFEIAQRGYSCQGNEFSLFMLLASNFVLNNCRGTNVYTIYPWAAQSINVLKADDQTKAVYFPDINPADKPLEAEISMAAGDFLEIYTEAEVWNCVATCFFIDCAHNIVDFVETIYKILKPGGIWVNLGPLLYHYADMKNENSIEPSYDILKEIIIQCGFQMENEDINVKSSYTQNPSSMMQYSYNSIFFVCRKPAPQEA